MQRITGRPKRFSGRDHTLLHLPGVSRAQVPRGPNTKMRRAFGFWRAVELVTSRISRTEWGARSEANRTGWREGKCARNNPVIGSVGLCPARTWVCFVGDRVTNMAWFQPTWLGFPFFFDPIEPVKQVDWEASKAFKLGVVPLSYMSLGACLKPRSRKSNHQRPRVSQNPHSELHFGRVAVSQNNL